MNLLRFQTHPDAANVNRLAYDTETSTLYVEFKPNGVAVDVVAYSYDGVPRVDYDYLTTCRQAVADFRLAQEHDHPLPEYPTPPREAVGLKVGSEASYVARVIVGNRNNPNHKTTKLDPVSASAIFPTTTQP